MTPIAVLNFLSLALTVSGAEWAIDSRTQSTLTIGVGSLPHSDSTAIAAVGQNGIGNFARLYDSSSDSWEKSSNVNTMMVLDAALSADGNAIMVGMGTTVSTDGAKTFQKIEDFAMSVSQAVYTYGDEADRFAVVGSFSTRSSGTPVSVYGVATIDSKGSKFELSANVPEGDVRYGSFPTETTWYVSQGMWDTSEDTESEYHSVSAHVNYHKKTGAIKMTSAITERNWPLKDTNETTNWWGAVSKTTDGGKTWKQVLRTDALKDYIYFNQISCGSELNCVVVGEGLQGPTGPDRVVVYTTFDGGNTWKETLSGTNDKSMMAAKFITAKEAWVGGVASSGRTASGQFYHSTDGGATWTMEQALDNCVPVDIDFGIEIGTAACISSSGSSSSVAFYK